MPRCAPQVFGRFFRRLGPTLGFLGFLGFTGFPATSFARQAPAPTDGAADYERLAEYLARGSGKWRADNPGYDAADPRSVQAFELWFERTLDGKVLAISVVARLKDQAYVTTGGTWIWHPGRNHIAYSTVGWDGTVSEGITSFDESDVFTTVTDAWGPDGTGRVYRDVNRMVEADVHENVSYLRDPSGAWVEQGVFRWKRLPA